MLRGEGFTTRTNQCIRQDGPSPLKWRYQLAEKSAQQWAFARNELTRPGDKRTAPREQVITIVYLIVGKLPLPDISTI